MLLVCQFERGGMNIVVEFDLDDRIAGLSLEPPATDVWPEIRRCREWIRVYNEESWLFADAYTGDGFFYAFMKSMETFETALDPDTILNLTTDSKLVARWTAMRCRVGSLVRGRLKRLHDRCFVEKEFWPR